MKLRNLLKTLDEMDQKGVWAFTLSSLKILFDDDSENTLKKSLKRHSDDGFIRRVARNLYVNERAVSAPDAKLEALVNYLKPGELNYLSRESRLSQLALISQMPVSRLTVTTTGNSKLFSTVYGEVEFTHTKRKSEELMDRVDCDPDTGLWLANEDLALEDQLNSGRNLDMLVGVHQ